MSRLYSRNQRGRQPLLGSSPRFSKAKEQPKETITNSKKNKPPPRSYGATPKTYKRKACSVSDDDDESSDLTSDFPEDTSDEVSEDADDEDDLPAVSAPSRIRKMNEAGRHTIPTVKDDGSVAGSTDSMFGDYQDFFDEEENPHLSPEENRKLFESRVFADSDDDNDIYLAVDDISDSEDDANIETLEEQELIALLSEDDNDDPNLLLNEIDGLSAYGFGDESDASIHRYASTQEDSGAEMSQARRVHFAFDGERALLRPSQSPTMARALLPSAMPEFSLGHQLGARQSSVDDLDDSDLTDDCLPEQAHSTPAPVKEERERSPSASPSSKKANKKLPKKRGPPRGIFIDEGTKPSGILDPSGKVILMTNPHLLGEEFARRYGASQASSPDAGFAELIDESDAEPGTELLNPGADIMLASLNAAINDPTNRGQATGLPEAFFPSTAIMLGDYVFDPNDLEDNFQPGDLGEDVINMDDVIQFDDETDDSDSPTSPIYMPPHNRGTQGLGNMNYDVGHLNNSNVTAFRRNADPTFAALSNTPSFRDLEDIGSPFATPSPCRKRKIHASPYMSSHYKGVTPVQRVRDPGQSATPDPVTPAVKRRKLMT